MKTMALNLKLGALAATVLLAGYATSVQAQNSPVGSWDIVMSGRQRGLMRLTFANDFTLSGTEIMSERPVSNNPPDDGDVRTPGGDGRNPEGEGSSATTRIYGGADIEGTWTYDIKGRVIGVYTELSRNVTNGVSFTATVRPTVRMNMVAHRDGRRLTFRAVPLTALADFSGNYYTSGIRDGKQFNELMTITPGTDPNSYDVAGVGPGYDLAGFLIVSKQNQIAVYTETSETTNGLLRAVSGSFNLTRGTGSVLGLSQDPLGRQPPRAVNVRATITKQ
jgi:hypothetical protein